MPQGRHKVPFSAKQKKTQLQEKRIRKKETEHRNEPNTSSSRADEPLGDGNQNAVQFVLKKDTALQQGESLIERGRDSTRYKLIFKKESEADLKRRREESHLPIEVLPQTSLEVHYDEFYVPGSELDFPKRPPWDFSMEKRLLEAKEERYFRGFVDSMQLKFSEEDLGYFELNLETWRQLWRVLEMSDIVLLVADVRHPVLHFPPALYSHITEELKKDVILVLNKVDLVAPSLVVAWKHYFQHHFPQLHILCFSAFGGMKLTTTRKGRRKGKFSMAADAAKRLLSTCRQIVKGAVDLSGWERKIEEELQSGELEDDEDLDALAIATNVHVTQADTSHYHADRFAQGVLTLGFLGHPNVGKSSLLNAIMGKKVVSVSRTPGHTKHFQTIFLTSEVRLCDCPGLVFPSRVPKAMQVLSGCYPIAQLREPFSSVSFIAQRMDLVKHFRLKHPHQEEGQPPPPWSSYDICEAWALQRGFLTARAGRPDVHRSGNHLLRMALDGRSLCLSFCPPEYFQKKDFWSSHPEVEVIKRLQGSLPLEEEKQADASGDSDENDSSQSSNEDDDSQDGLPTAVNKFQLLSEDN